jgi:glucose/arabinose dehydrogenase
MGSDQFAFAEVSRDFTVMQFVCSRLSPDRLFVASALMFLLMCGNCLAQVPDNTVSYPATGFWNGFLDQLNVVECNNFGASDDEVRLTLRDRFGASLSERIFTVKALGTVHVVLSGLADLRNSYGTYRLEVLPGSSGKRLRCLSAFYRFSSRQGRSVDYAFVLPVEDARTGVSAGLFNSMDPETSGKPVENWLSVYNPSTVRFSATLRLYDMEGALLSERRLDLSAGQRTDVALGHDDPSHGYQNVGLYRIVPDVDTAPYIAFLSRYGTDSRGVRFGFTLLPSAGGCAGVSGFAATVNNAVNWAEIANIGDTDLDVSVEVYDRAGVRKGAESFRIAKDSQHHLYLNRHIGENNVGSFRLVCGSNTGKVIAQSLFYGRAPDLKTVSWAYASQQRRVQGADSTRLGVSVNTYLGMQNWLKLLDGAGDATDVRLELFSAAGTRAVENAIALSARTSTDVGLHETFVPNTVGEGLISFHEANANVSAEVLRVFPAPGGGVESIMLVPTFPLPESTLTFDLVEVATGLNMPLAAVSAGDSSGRMFIVEREGRVRVLKSGVLLPTPFLDISSQVSTEGEMGMLGIAFHPEFETNGRFFIAYSALTGTTVLSEFSVSLNPDLADAASEREILRVDQPHYFHKGGQLAFGPDGYLYASFGDGGFSGDPLDNGRNLGTLLGKIVRIDISAMPYAVPPDNPYVGVTGALPEIWASGFRNPWRFSFDRVTNELFAADVGENLIEEIDIVRKGGDYGWSTLEGSVCFKPTNSCSREGTILPISEYRHSEGLAAIGGFVYRGSEIPDLYGRYVFADYVSGHVWTLERSASDTFLRSRAKNVDFYVSAFGEDEAGELYVVSIFGDVFKIVAG